MKSKEVKIKIKCPYCNRIQTYKNFIIGEIVAVRDYYFYPDVQCNSCGSKYDLRMDFFPSIYYRKERLRQLEKENKKNDKKNS